MTSNAPERDRTFNSWVLSRLMEIPASCVAPARGAMVKDWND